MLGTAPAFSNSTPLWTSRVASPPSSRIMFGPLPSGQVSICSVHHQYSGSVSPFQAKTGTPAGASTVPFGPDHDGGGGVVLGGEDVAGDPADVGAERDEGLDQHGGLHGHVQRAGDPGAGQRLARRRTPRAGPSGRASRARRAGSRCGRTRPGTGRRPCSRRASAWWHVMCRRLPTGPQREAARWMRGRAWAQHDGGQCWRSVCPARPLRANPSVTPMLRDPV